MDFLAIDFETATSKNSSACSLGMVFVSGTKIMHEEYFLIKPPGLKVDPLNSRIHGLTAEHLKDAPSFEDVWKKIAYFFHPHCHLVAHNAQFDMNVLKNCLIESDIKIPEFNYFCSMAFSTRACRGQNVGRSLRDRAQYFGVTMESHHNALSDARVCAEIVLKSMEEKKKETVDKYLQTFSSIPLKSFSDLRIEETFSKIAKNKKQSVAIAEITPTVTSIQVSHPLFGKSIAFTGELNSLSRKEAMQQAVNVGAILKSTVSKKTIS